MKNQLAVVLFDILTEIAKAANDAPSKFTINLKLAVSENRRALAPIVEDYNSIRNALIVELGEPVLNDQKEVLPGQFIVKQGSTNYPKFKEEEEKLNTKSAKVRLRRIYEKDLAEAPITVDQLTILKSNGVLILDETKTDEIPE